MNQTKKPELLAPAGNFEKLKYALAYGADAVYCAGKKFGLRARADNFDEKTLEQAVIYTHNKEKKIFVTLNMIPHDNDFEGLADYIRFLDKINVDAVLVADPGVFTLVREITPNMKISVSTQANNVNSRSVKFWHDLGASRIVLARELSGKEIQDVCQNRPGEMEIETFVHGAMCISYSGRCLLSHYLTGRDGNRGDCAQPCRWQYQLEESKRPGEFFPIEEDKTGTFIMNSKDLCLAEKIPELIKFGVNSFKIEGRMKSAFYVATVVSVYRKIIDAALANPDFTVPHAWIEELTKISHRHYTTAFYDHTPSAEAENFGSSSYTRNYDFSGIVLEDFSGTGRMHVEQRGKILVGDYVEIIQPEQNAGHPLFLSCQVKRLFDEQGNEISSTPHAKMHYQMEFDHPVKKMSILRKQLI
ncbi:peptidase U32 family protein [Pseudoramibacter porci]|uniref:U32 family peptidase n=1 Tax=Pseudoramibacter porci TaxID=2606631 RepID=A0A7X2NGV9_9FIRM|nr:U32 family peptidase [Pseudoramibacter porci]MSS20310.1 U32 family peptidase [Pseudoramibacter porci]